MIYYKLFNEDLTIYVVWSSDEVLQVFVEEVAKKIKKTWKIATKEDYNKFNNPIVFNNAKYLKHKKEKKHEMSNMQGA